MSRELSKPHDPLPVLRCWVQMIVLLFVLAPLPIRASDRQVNAPTPRTVATAGFWSGSVDDDEGVPLISPDSMLYRTIKYAGKFHLVVIHFPIAFLLGAALVQCYRVVSGKGDDVVTTLLWFGALGAIGAAVLGWMFAYDSVYFGDDEKILFWHRWLGTSTAAVSLVVLLLRRKLGPKSLAIALILCAGFVTAAGHFGGSLTRGADFLMEFPE